MPTHAEITDKGLALAMSLSNEDIDFSNTWIVHFLTRLGVEDSNIANCDIKKIILSKLKTKELSDEELLHLAIAHSNQDRRLRPDPASGLTEFDQDEDLPSRTDVIRKAQRLRSIMGLSLDLSYNDTFTVSEDWIKRHRIFYGIHNQLTTEQIKDLIAVKLRQDEVSEVVDTRLSKRVLTKLGRKLILNVEMLDLASEKCIVSDDDDDDSDEDDNNGNDEITDNHDAVRDISNSSESEYEGIRPVNIASDDDDDQDDQGDQVGSEMENDKMPEPASESEYADDLVSMSSDDDGKED
ncbi:hypothetical protein BGX28_004943 [Mortierella sp. GBA30]|nr:hypothetical protein BGX28_004943 [Mortierella sp. GBA30]